MSTIADKARAEAEEAERDDEEQQQDQDDQSTDDDVQDEPQPAHPGEGLEEPSDAMIVELQAACDEHHDRVHMIMGPFVSEFVPCETCNGIGLAYPAETGPKLEPAPGLELCDVCKGPGELETPSRRPGYDVIQCTRCSGQGYIGTLAIPSAQMQQLVEQYPQHGEQPTQPQPQPQPQQSTDPRVEALRADGYIVIEKPTG